MNVKFTGILKLTLDDAALRHVRRLWTELPPEAHPLDEKHLHVTLVHQSILRPFKDLMAGLTLPACPNVQLDERVFRVVRPDRTSWLALAKNQAELQAYVDRISGIIEAKVGTSINEQRVFHVSLANLKGDPFMSVGDVRWDDVGGMR